MKGVADNLKKGLVTGLTGLLLFLLPSCIDSKKAIYFNNIRDTTFNDLIQDAEPVIQKNDLLSIYVSSLNPEATVIFNTPNMPSVSVSQASSGSSNVTGYLVSGEGDIQFPVIGKIAAEGLTKKQLTDRISKTLVSKKLLTDPIVTIRFLNFRITVLGEVSRPTVITVANEKISILEAIGLAGDLTIYAKRDNVLVIREENKKKIIKRINLNSSEIFTSPYYYLKTNDIVYAEPNNARIASTSNTRQIVPIVLSGLSFFAIILDRIFR